MIYVCKDIYDSRKIICNKSYLTPGGEFYHIS